MNKATQIQRSKIFSANGGVGSTIETIDNLSLQILPFNKWNVYNTLASPRTRALVQHLLFEEPRLQARLASLHFNQLQSFFQLEGFEGGNEVKEYSPTPAQQQQMVSSRLFPRFFYCPHCHTFMDIDEWRQKWGDKNLPGDLIERIPVCPNEAKVSRGGKVMAPYKLVQVRFVLVSLETGDIRDIPWKEIFDMKKKSLTPRIWELDNSTKTCSSISYYIGKGSSNLFGIGVRNNAGELITMAEIMGHIFVIDEGSKKVAYKPVIRNANNVYYAYNLSSVYIPKNQISVDTVDKIKQYYDLGITDAKQIKKVLEIAGLSFSESEIQSVIDNNFAIPDGLSYSSEEEFRLDELEFLTDKTKYKIPNNVLEEDRLTSIIYPYPNKNRIANIFYQKRLCVTTTQVAYSRVDKIGLSNLSNWEGFGDPPKSWLDTNTMQISESIPVKLRPTCEGFRNIEYMPALQSYGEGFLVEMDLTDIAPDDREVYLHTFCHLIMKELEFSCGYPVASLSERLYYLPKEKTNAVEDRYGFMIYAVGGSTGSYGGITSLFYSHRIDDIIEQAVERAKDCPNDPICENEKGHCFACVDVPETACEEFNTKLSRTVFNAYN